ncbi:MAG: TIGR02677 family protein [Paenibacillaceae bacterium]
MDEHLLRPIPEASYLTVNNAWRYRSLLRYFYQQHERLRHYLFPEEIYSYLKNNSHFREYTEDQLQQDLDQLVVWRNLVPRQETGRVSSIEEFKKKKYRYQLTPYTIEIERMVFGLEQLGEGFGGSLERTLFDKLLQALLKLAARSEHSIDGQLSYDILRSEPEEVHLLWQELYDSFRKLTENATDYLAHLQSEKVEEKMMTEAFLVYKDAVTEYLRNFMTSLQRTSFRIEALLEDIGGELIHTLAGKLAEYELSIPRLDERPDKEQLMVRFQDQWHVLKTWFVGNETMDSDIMYLQNATNETIRRLTRFAQRLGESHNNLRSRRMDYMHLARWFDGMETLGEAHELSSCVFGVLHTRHLLVEQPKKTEAIDAEIWDEPPFVIRVRPRVKAYAEKQKPNAVIDHTDEKQAMLNMYLQQKAEEQRLMEQLIQSDRIVFSQLPIVNPFIRKTLLIWIAKCMSNANRVAKTETGRRFQLIKLSDHSVQLEADDGVMELPDYVFRFFPQEGELG